MTKPDASRALASSAWLASIFWVSYAIWNTVWPEPPQIGPLTVINVLYLAMLPAAVVGVVAWRRHPWPGRLAYALFLGWLVIGLAWHGAHDVDVVKRLIVYGLCGATAAQLLLGSRHGPMAFVASLLLVAFALALWTIGYALASGFAYRAGMPINPNLPATLIGPGLLAALVLALRPEPTRARPLALLVLLTSLYASLLLGSRGILAALVAAAAVACWHLRPAPRRAVTTAVASALVVALAQSPTIAYGMWSGGLATLAAVRRAVLAPVGTGSATPATPDDDRDPWRLRLDAAASTAVGRLQEDGIGSFNLRGALWEAAAWYLVSDPRALLTGGGMGKSEELAHTANPVFRNVHHAWLQIAVDFGLIGLALLAWSHWAVAGALARLRGWLPALGLAIVTFWVVLGLTATITDLHVYWVSLGAAGATAAGARVLTASATAESDHEPS